MPVVLTEVGGRARSGHLYGDRTGIEYEYPVGRYERWIQTGERFLYHRPRVGYVGCGLVGDIQPSEQVGRLVCDVVSVRMFESAVPLMGPAGSYYEADPAAGKDKVFFAQGVRPLSDVAFEAVVASAGMLLGDPDPIDAAYADSTVARAVEDYSVNVALAEAASRFGQTPEVMPRNNPGFDLRVGTASVPTRYIEVKGTQSPNPVFFMTDGEREFSFRNSTLYTLIVVAGIDLAAARHTSVSVRDGAVAGEGVTLRPNQWRGSLARPKVDLTWPPS